jgi:hypothetical protein
LNLRETADGVEVVRKKGTHERESEGLGKESTHGDRENRKETKMGTELKEAQSKLKKKGGERKGMSFNPLT